MSIHDKKGDPIVTVGGVWSLLLKTALVSIPVLLTMAFTFAIWIVHTINGLQLSQAVMFEKIKHLSPTAPKASE